MSNEDLPQRDELASAYLDGELDGPERAAAGTDPGVMETIDSFTRIRAELGAIDPVDPMVKDAAVAAALAEFDAIRSAGTTAPAPAATAPAPVVSLQSRRHRAYRVITSVAAAAIVTVVAVAALNSTRQSNNDSVSSATAVPAIASRDSSPELKSVAADAGASIEAAPAATEAAASGNADSAVTTVPVIESTEALAQYAATIEAAATTAAAPAGTQAGADTSPAAAAPTAQQAPPSVGYAAIACLGSEQFVLGSIVYRGTPALAVRNTASGALQAIADTDCRVLDEVPAP